MAKKEQQTFADIMKDLKARRYAPVYYLMGDEPYYIDVIADYIADNALQPEERDFNQTVVYGSDVDVSWIINAAKRYPMMSERQVVIVKEAQNVSKMDELCFYLQKPQMSTVLVMCHKNGTLDRRKYKKLAADIERTGVLFESKRLRDGMLPGFVNTYVASRGLTIDPKGAQMMAESIGSDLSRMAGELDKLAIVAKAAGTTTVTPDMIERNIGISKEYNNFELRSALVEKDELKANRIIKYFAENPSANPIQLTLALLFKFFSDLMLAYYAPDRSERSVAAYLGLTSEWAAQDYTKAMRRYTGVKVMQIIREIRYTDARSKGVGVSSGTISNYDLMRELVFKILH